MGGGGGAKKGGAVGAEGRQHATLRHWYPPYLPLVLFGFGGLDLTLAESTKLGHSQTGLVFI